MCNSENSGHKDGNTDKTDRHPFLAHETSDMTLVYLLTKTVTDCTADQGQDSQELPGSPEHF